MASWMLNGHLCEHPGRGVQSIKEKCPKKPPIFFLSLQEELPRVSTAVHSLEALSHVQTAAVIATSHHRDLLPCLLTQARSFAYTTAWSVRSYTAEALIWVLPLTFLLSWAKNSTLQLKTGMKRNNLPAQGAGRVVTQLWTRQKFG